MRCEEGKASLTAVRADLLDELNGDEVPQEQVPVARPHHYSLPVPHRAPNRTYTTARPELLCSS